MALPHPARPYMCRYMDLGAAASSRPAETTRTMTGGQCEVIERRKAPCHGPESKSTKQHLTTDLPRGFVNLACLKHETREGEGEGEGEGEREEKEKE